MQTAWRLFITLLLLISLGGTDHIATSESSPGFAVNSTFTISPLPKTVITGKKQDVVDSQGGKNAVLDAVELIDPKASEQVLELIVKIAEHPAIWKQIHRVLETLEANNAAYSQRIDATRSETGWTNKRLERPGDKRNDVPDDKMTIISNSTGTSISPQPSLETAFHRWREVLFAAKDSHLVHPQLEASELQSNKEPNTEQDVQRRYVSSAGVPNQPEQIRSEKNFEERLSEIEDELKKLMKLSRTLPQKMKHLNTFGRQQEKRGKMKTSKIPIRNGISQNQTDDLRPVIKGHPKFQYHKVHNNTNQQGTSSLLGPNYWRKIASLKDNGSNPTSRRNSFVAVSITHTAADDKHEREESLTANGQQQGMPETEQNKSAFGKPCKKTHIGRKQMKQRPLNSRQANSEDQSGDYLTNG